jgi:RNA polymerase sigma-70 factor (ECF subfamily)
MGDVANSLTTVSIQGHVCAPGRDEQAWRDFCQRYQPLIAQWCRPWRLQAADVEDVTQRVLERVFTRVHTYDPRRGRFRGWLRTVVDNAVKDFLRARGRRPDQAAGDSDVAGLLDAIAQPASIDGLVEDLDSSLRGDADAVWARVERAFEPKTLLAFRRVLLEDRPIAEVAAELGKSYAAVCMAVRRVKDKLLAEGAWLAAQRLKAEEDGP